MSDKPTWYVGPIPVSNCKYLKHFRYLKIELQDLWIVVFALTWAGYVFGQVTLSLWDLISSSDKQGSIHLSNTYHRALITCLTTELCEKERDDFQESLLRMNH